MAQTGEKSEDREERELGELSPMRYLSRAARNNPKRDYVRNTSLGC